MTREELIAYDRWLTENKWGSSEIITPEQAADLYLAKHPLPPAEGAEEILLRQRNGEDKPITYAVGKGGWVYKMILRAMTEFATLHAQRIADKMVSERLREELIRYIKWYGGFNYENMTDEMLVNEYLKTREK